MEHQLGKKRQNRAQRRQSPQIQSSEENAPLRIRVDPVATAPGSEFV
jgi:hypothetical protein